jgi:5'-phosphate synthase pdxT subunit
MLRLMESNGLRRPLDAFVRTRPVLGTCAGVILLGRGGERLPYPPLGALDVEVERNAYGRQIDSFSAVLEAPVVGGGYHGVFIRAPRIRRLGEGVEVIATLPGPGGAADPVGVRQDRIVGLCFHPELTADLRFHRWFLERVAGLSPPSAGTTEAQANPETRRVGAEPA